MPLGRSTPAERLPDLGPAGLGEALRDTHEGVLESAARALGQIRGR